jgi:ferrochelatase
VLEKIRPYFDHPGFVEANVAAVLDAVADLPADQRDGARLVFVTHSIPDAMNDESGPAGGAYLAQHRSVAAEVARRVADETGVEREHDLVFCSRSGSPRTPWLEPDVNDRLQELADQGVTAVVLAPIGFVSDHMEVVYDLDTEALATAAKVGVEARRAATAGTDPRFVAALRELVVEGAVARDTCGAGCCLPRAEQ